MVTRPVRPLATVALAAAALTVTSACGVGDKQDQADVITRTPEAAVEQRTASGTLTIESKPKRSASSLRSAAPAAAAALGGTGAASLSAPVRFDFAGGRAEVVVSFAPPAAAPPEEPPPEEPPPDAPPPDAPPADAPAEPTEPAPARPSSTTAVFEREVAYVQRVNRRPAERRVWAGLDFGDLPSDEAPPDQADMSDTERLYALATTINPRYLLELAEGALAGSVELMGTDDLGGVVTQHYRANMSIEKATDEVDLDEDEIETRRQTFRLVGIGGDVHKAEFWVDAEGRLRRSRFGFDQRLVPRVHNRVTVTLDMTSYGDPIELLAPAKEETVRVDRYGRFVRAALPRDT